MAGVEAGTAEGTGYFSHANVRSKHVHDINIGGHDTVRRLDFIPDSGLESCELSRAEKRKFDWRKRFATPGGSGAQSSTDNGSNADAPSYDLPRLHLHTSQNHDSTASTEKNATVEGACAALAHSYEYSHNKYDDPIPSSPPPELYARARYAATIGRNPYCLPWAMREASDLSRDILQRRAHQRKHDPHEPCFISAEEWKRIAAQIPVQEWELLRYDKKQAQREELDKYFRENIANMAQVIRDGNDLDHYDSRRLVFQQTLAEPDLDADKDFLRFCRSATFLPGREWPSVPLTLPSQLCEFARQPRMLSTKPVSMRRLQKLQQRATSMSHTNKYNNGLLVPKTPPLVSIPWQRKQNQSLYSELTKDGVCASPTLPSPIRYAHQRVPNSKADNIRELLKAGRRSHHVQFDGVSEMVQEGSSDYPTPPVEYANMYELENIDVIPTSQDLS